MSARSQNIRVNSINTRKRILDIAQMMILEYGYSGASIDLIIEKASITKSGFFYHFESKRDLAISLLVSFLEENKMIAEQFLLTVRKETDDPLKQLLRYIELYAELANELPSGHPGCLVAAYIYESRQFDDEIHEIARKGMQDWEKILEGLIYKTKNEYPAVVGVDAEDLSSMFTGVFEGGIILSKLVRDPKKLGAQVMHYRRYLQLIFQESVG
tara:strand:- start:816 stop:1457 length:642 start_codon:yes stop_codon:yes gene_type:complete